MNGPLAEIDEVDSTRKVPGFTAALAQEMRPFWNKVNTVVTPMEWPHFAPRIKAINELKKQKNAVILAHNYMTPEIYHCVADIRGDSLQLAIEATRTDAEVIVQAGVYFMAETSKLLCPEKTVLIPDLDAGCSLAASIAGRDVRALRQRHPGVPIVTYVNTSAEVKAESDVCCTSANVLKVVESLGVSRVILLPDEYLANFVQSQTEIEIITWQGRCEVHEQYQRADLVEFREQDPNVKIVAHPECSPEVLSEADFTGSTSNMISYIKDTRPSRVFLVTECSMATNISSEVPEVEFVKPCNICPHMKRISLDGIYDCLTDMRHEVTIDPDVASRANQAIQRMLEITA